MPAAHVTDTDTAKDFQQSTSLLGSSPVPVLHHPFPTYPRDSFVSDFVLEIIQLLVLVLFCGLISIVGIIANAINIILFFRQGALSSSCNVSLLTLAFVDVGCLLSTLFSSVSFLVIQQTEWFMNPHDFIGSIAMWVYIMFLQSAALVTAYIAFERCVSVLFPFKAKDLFCAKRTLLIMVTAIALNSLSFLPSLVTVRLEKVLDKNTNREKFQYAHSKTRIEILIALDYFHVFFLRALLILIVLFCTQITVFKVKKSQSWRRTIAASKQDSKSKTASASQSSDPNESVNSDDKDGLRGANATDTDSGQLNHPSSVANGNETAKDPAVQREKRLAILITTMSAIFLVCNLPDTITVYCFRVVPSLKDIPFSNNIFQILIVLQYLLGSVNSSINIVAYYKLSTRYRQELLAWVGQRQNSNCFRIFTFKLGGSCHNQS